MTKKEQLQTYVKWIKYLENRQEKAIVWNEKIDRINKKEGNKNVNKK